MENRTRYPHPQITQRQITHAEGLRVLNNVLLAFHSLKSDLTLDQMLLLLAVARYPGIQTKELARLTGLSQASVSRNTNALASLHRKGSPGLGMIDQRPDPEETRRYQFYMTKRGLDVLADVVQVVEYRRCSVSGCDYHEKTPCDCR